MEQRALPYRDERLYLLVAGCGFLAVAGLSTVLSISGPLDTSGLQVAILFGFLGSIFLTFLPWTSRMARFEAIPTGMIMDDWAEGTAVWSPGARGGLLGVGDKVRWGVSGDGLRVRRTVRTEFAAGAWFLAFYLLSLMFDSIAGSSPRPRSPENLPLLAILPIMVLLAGLLAFDPPSSRHDTLRPWRDVARIVETKDSLFIHWRDGSAPLVGRFPPYATRRILSRLAAHATVEEYVRSPRPAGPDRAGSIDAGTERDLNRALDNLRRLED